MSTLRVAHFTVAANVEQSARWKQAAEAAGHLAVGTWLVEAADAYLKATAPGADVERQAPRPLPLAWHSAQFRVILASGKEVEVRGMVAPPFGQFQGTTAGPSNNTGRVLVHLPTGRVLASVRGAQRVKDLAAELAPALLRGLPPPDPGGILEQYRREAS
jgi:hypothetical protein